MMLSLFSLLLLLVLLLLVDYAAAECKACVFDGNDSSDCIVYGKLGDQVKEWNTGARECKGWYNIAISSIDPETSCMNVNAFVNSLRFGDLQYSDSKLGLGVGSEGGAFFVQNAADNNRIDMVDSITINGETTNCAASANNCFNAMKPYFTNDPEGQIEYNQVCTTLYNKVRVDRNLEESVLRVRLCQEHKNGTNIIIECNPLALQVGEEVKANPERDCSGYGFETPLTEVAGCETALAEVEREIASTTGGASSGEGTTGGSSGGSTTGSGGSGSSGSGTSSSICWKHTTTMGLVSFALASFVLV